jgi:hypothetical protein
MDVTPDDVSLAIAGADIDSLFTALLNSTLINVDLPEPVGPTNKRRFFIYN